MRSSKDIRQGFIDFFADKSHTFVPGSPLVLPDDPTLLFTNAGMNQFKPIFLGKERARFPRAVNYQRCMRVSGKHNDLDEVGFSPHHHTLFEMLGNWSFGDYYKRDAIVWAWELLTEVLGLPEDKLYVTVFEDRKKEIPSDTESEEIWRNEIGLPPEKIIRLGRKDNFWEMGDTGPCGPCTEIHIDRGPDACQMKHVPGHVCSIESDCRRFTELWNLVFIQFNRISPQKLIALPEQHVDTGMGLERITAVLQGKANNFETDLFQPVMDKIQMLSRQSSAERKKQSAAYQVIADHARAIAFLITDNVMPSNEWRGYVLRRILRRAVRFGTKLHLQPPFLFDVIQIVIEQMGSVYPELAEARNKIQHIVNREEKQFFKTLHNGLPMVRELIEAHRRANQSILDGKEVFKLYDTYGFPVDITQDIAVEEGMTIDMQGFEAEMEIQKQRARSAWKSSDPQPAPNEIDLDFNAIEPVKFVGYSKYSTESTIKAIVLDGKQTDNITSPLEFDCILNPTPFYAESGGQVSDIGIIETPTTKIKVIGSKKISEKIALCRCKLLAGELRVGDTVHATIDRNHRKAVAGNHTATHLLHAALRSVLGIHVKQSGSLVAPDRLRFDFSHFKAIEPDELDAIEQMVNEWVIANETVTVQEMRLEEALKAGATALFSEKYSDPVRVVEIGSISMELCGGTHVPQTGNIGPFKLLSESSIATGIRRIEAVTGMTAVKQIIRNHALIKQVSKRLNIASDAIPERIDNLLKEVKSLTRRTEELKGKLAKAAISSSVADAVQMDGFKLVVHKAENLPGNLLRDVVDQIKYKLESGIIVAGSINNNKVLLIVAVTDDLTQRFHAGKLIKIIASKAGGSGGGRKDMAQAGSNHPEKLDEALKQAPELIRAFAQK